MPDIELDRLYTRDDPEWLTVLLVASDGKEVEVWWDDRAGRRGKLVKESTGYYTLHHRYVIRKALPAVEVTSVRILKHREPSWAGARVLLDGDGTVWIWDGESYKSGIMGAHPDAIRGPVTVLLDANGRIPVDSMMAVNGLTKTNLGLRFVAAMAGRCRTAENYGDVIITALGGKS